MKIYYLKYYKGDIAVSEYDVIQAPNHDYYLNSALNGRTSFNKEDEGEVTEYSLGDIRIWVTEKGSLELAFDKLKRYAINFHRANIQRYERNKHNENIYLVNANLQELAIK